MGEPTAPRRRLGTGGWVLLVVGALVAVLTAVGAGGNLLSVLTRDAVTGGESFRGVAGVAVDNDCGGDVALRGVPGGTGIVEVTWRDRSSLGEPRHSQELRGDELVVEVDCPAFSLGWSPTSALALSVPDDVPITVRASSGDVTARDLGAASALRTGAGDIAVVGSTGDLDLRTGSGEVFARGARGDVVARTGSGDVELEGVEADRVDVEVGSGDVELDAASPPGAVRIRGGSGDLDVELPGRTTAYSVEADSGSGEVSIGVLDDPSATRTIDLRAGSGDVSVRGGTGQDSDSDVDSEGDADG